MGGGLFLQENTSKGKKNDNKEPQTGRDVYYKAMTPHHHSVHAPLTPSQWVDTGPSYLTTDVLAILAAGVEEDFSARYSADG